jgi:K+-transporting ATPase A subunit
MSCALRLNQLGPEGGVVTGRIGHIQGHEFAAVSRSMIARQTRSGVNGKSRITTQVAWCTAAASAGAVQSRAPSLTPLGAVGSGAVLVLDRECL